LGSIDYLFVLQSQLPTWQLQVEVQLHCWVLLLNMMMVVSAVKLGL
jgi:hypothetical protein